MRTYNTTEDLVTEREWTEISKIDRLITATRSEVLYVERHSNSVLFAAINLAESYPEIVLAYQRETLHKVVGVAMLGEPVIGTPWEIAEMFSDQPLQNNRFKKWKFLKIPKIYAYPVLRFHLFDKPYSSASLLLPEKTFENAHVKETWNNLRYRPSMRETYAKIISDLRVIRDWKKQ
jgi:hypothetical protein